MLNYREGRSVSGLSTPAGGRTFARCWMVVAGLTAITCGWSLDWAQAEPALDPLLCVVDLEVGEETSVTLCDGSRAVVELLRVEERRDVFREAVREAAVTVKVNGKTIRLVAASYNLPVNVGGVQIDCPITSGYVRGSSQANVWALNKSARLRLWPAGSPWIRPGTFVYPAKQRWFATHTQMANVPVFVDGGDRPANKRIYYHSGLDIGGAEALVEVVAATDGLVVSARGDVIDGLGDDTPVRPRADVVYLRDQRGWYYRYSHLHTINDTVQLGQQLKLGDAIGLIGKEGASGGWSHLHFGIDCRQPSGEWGALEGYAFLWQAYVAQYQPDVLAVARPHHLVAVGEQVILDGAKSWAANGKRLSYTWISGDKRIGGQRLKKIYDQPGTYSEILRVRDRVGRMAYDFAEVQVVDPAQPEQLPPTIHAAYWPTSEIVAGDRVTFKVRSFRAGIAPTESWDFGDGTPRVSVRSDGNAEPLAKDGYAVTQHRFTKPGDYIVSVQTTNAFGYTATGRLHVRVGPVAN